MRFYAHATDGGSGRHAATIVLVNGDGGTHTITTDRIDTGPPAYTPQLRVRSVVGSVEFVDVNEAAQLVAQLLHQCRGHSTVIEAGGGTTSRGDERTSADVYPPYRHPRIVIEGE
jgi:hypothetical protein